MKWNCLLAIYSDMPTPWKRKICNSSRFVVFLWLSVREFFSRSLDTKFWLNYKKILTCRQNTFRNHIMLSARSLFFTFRFKYHMVCWQTILNYNQVIAVQKAFAFTMRIAGFCTIHLICIQIVIHFRDKYEV